MEPHAVTFARDPILLAGPANLYLSVNHLYRVLRSDDKGHWKVRTAAYYYEFEDIDERELIAFHWHPETVPSVPYPHLHINRGVVAMDMLISTGVSSQHNPLRPEIAAAHIPTSRIALEQVIELAIRQFDVPPLRADWQSVLGANLRLFDRARSWAMWPQDSQ